MVFACFNFAEPGNLRWKTQMPILLPTGLNNGFYSWDFHLTSRILHCRLPAGIQPRSTISTAATSKTRTCGRCQLRLRASRICTCGCIARHPVSIKTPSGRHGLPQSPTQREPQTYHVAPSHVSILSSAD
ncbi:hypothetical protein TNIN_235451 [Trichonephila inaurata madagascariensis]|uniref:Uncharacterized protein n=1 Tax=Trichonephila inaurata madagascariensis TaxID=2747483 RepID=A0A8X6XK95_9ARAC|nr:hypothetical protein TNIN_235451 [Trichonephila inaurata madagascariensis]